DLTSSCSQFSDRVMNGSVRFREQESLRLALDDAVKKYLGEVWVWNRAKSPVDVAPLCAVTLAIWGVVLRGNDGVIRVSSLSVEWVLYLAKSPVDVAPLCAVTMALWGLEMLGNDGEVRVTAYGEGYGDWYQPVSKDNEPAFSGATTDGGRWWE